MNKLKILSLLFWFATTSLCAQDNSNASSVNKVRQHLLTSLKMYHYADSVNKVQKPGFLDSSIYQMAASLDQQEPAAYFAKVDELLSADKYNEASFLMYVGTLRFRYYALVNPNYHPGADGNRMASFRYAEILPSYLETNVENYIALLRLSADWYTKHDYTFFPRSHDPAKYDDQAKGINYLIADLVKNKEQYRKEWGMEKRERERSLAATLKALDAPKKKVSITQ